MTLFRICYPLRTIKIFLGSPAHRGITFCLLSESYPQSLQARAVVGRPPTHWRWSEGGKPPHHSPAHYANGPWMAYVSIKTLEPTRSYTVLFDRTVYNLAINTDPILSVLYLNQAFRMMMMMSHTQFGICQSHTLSMMMMMMNHNATYNPTNKHTLKNT